MPLHHTVWYDEHKEMPTVDMMKHVWTLPDEKDPAYEKKALFLMWYVDTWLPYAAGHENWGPTIRYWHKLTDTRKIGTQDKILVTVQSEAFAWLILDNCFNKWKVITKHREDDSSKKIPDYNEKDTSTHKFYDTKWSDQHSGAIEGGGWQAGAYPVFNTYMKLVHAFRKKDEKAGYELQDLVKAWLRDLHSINSPEYSKKKKQKKNDTTALDPATFEEIDEYDD